MAATTSRLSLALFASLTVTGAGRAADDLKALLKAAWGQLAQLDAADKSYSIEHLPRPQPDKPGFTKVISVTGRCAKRQSAVSVCCWNSQYTFNLKTAKRGKAGDWLLGHVEIAPPSSNKLKELMLRNGFDIVYFKPLTALFDTTCDRALADGNLVIQDSSRLDGGLLKASIIFTAHFRHKPEEFTGYIIVDPERQYVILESQIVWPTVMRGGAKYVRLIRTVDRTDGDGLKVTEIKFPSLDEEKKALTYTEWYAFKDYTFGPTDLAEYRTSHYGIPEPQGVEPLEEPTPLYMWLALVGVLSAVIAAVALFLRRRSTTTSAE